MGNQTSIGRAPSWALWLAGVALAAAAVSVLAALEPSARLAHHSLPLQASYETAAAFVAMLVAYLLAGRYGRTRGRRDLVLAGGVAVLALSNLFFLAIPAVADARDGVFAGWASTLGALIASIAIAVGSFMRNEPVFDPARAGAVAAGIVLLVVGLIAAVIGAFADRLSLGVDFAVSPADSSLVSGNAVLVAANLIAALAFWVAALGFLGRARRDEFLRWFAVASVLAGFARLNYFLLPPSLSSWLSTGDALRMSFYLVLLAGAAWEIGLYQRNLARYAAEEERRRVARELHDGLAQELGYISTLSDLIGGGKGTPQNLEALSQASRRAMQESRALIQTLYEREERPLRERLEQVAAEVSNRSGMRVSVFVERGLDSGPEVCETLVRVVQESLNNAARHGEAERARVDVFATGEVRLRVVDDGRGYDSTVAGSDGFGISGMRDRVHAVGGQLRLRSRPGKGTEVEVVLP